MKKPARARNPRRKPGGRPAVSPRSPVKTAIDGKTRWTRSLSQEVLDALPSAIAVLDARGVIVAVNQLWLSFASENGIRDLKSVTPGASYLDVCRRASAANAPGAAAALDGLLSVLDGTRADFRMEYDCSTPGVMRWFIVVVRPLPRKPRRTVVIHIDITRLKEAQQASDRLLAEKETLLLESHHRVKNNLQIISSLFNLQSGYVHDRQFLTLLRESQMRVDLMAMIYEQLYQTGNLEEVNFSDLLKNDARSLARAYDSGVFGIGLRFDLQPVSLSVSTAVRFGIVAHELISNAFKHAFPGGRKGTVSAAVRRDGVERVILQIDDDGVGFAGPGSPDGKKTLGMRLVNMVVQQINGTFTYRSDGGLHCTVAIPVTMESRSRPGPDQERKEN